MSIASDFALKNKVVLITGGCGLLGPEMGTAFADAGAVVFLCDVDSRKGRDVLSRMPKRVKSRISFLPLDVTKEDSIKAVLSSVMKTRRRLDVLVNAAIASGTSHFSRLEDYDMEHWKRVMDVNVNGTFMMTRAAAALMIKEGIRGSVINFGSIYGVVGADQRIYGKSALNSPPVYAASKGAIINMTRYFAVYWGSMGIRVNSISPGGVANGQADSFVKKYSFKTPLGRMMHKNEIQGAALFLASEASSYVTGHNLMVDGGWTAW